MRELAAAGRRAGLTFDEWWEEAVRPGLPPVITTNRREIRPERCVVWPSDSQDCKSWRVATEDVRDGWRRSYEQIRPERREAALRILAPALAALLGHGPLPELPELPERAAA